MDFLHTSWRPSNQDLLTAAYDVVVDVAVDVDFDLLTTLFSQYGSLFLFIPKSSVFIELVLWNVII